MARKIREEKEAAAKEKAQSELPEEEREKKPEGQWVNLGFGGW